MLLTWLAVAFLLLAAFQWSRTWDVYGGWPPSLFLLMLRNATRTAQSVFFFASCFGLATTAILMLAPGWLPPIPPELALAVSLLGLTRSLLPPAVLILGGSNPATGALAADLYNAVFPLRIVHLLDPMSAKPDAFRGEEIETTTERTARWLEHVEELMAFVPVIVIDLRHATREVRIEAELAARKHLAKSLFVRSDDARVVDTVLARLRRS